MAPKFNGYLAYVLPDAVRARLLEQFPPKYPDVIAHHVTEKFGVTDDEPVSGPAEVRIIGYVDDGEGLEALVAMVDGNVTNGNGNLYHCTWSLDRSMGYKPVDSNRVLKQIDPVNVVEEVYWIGSPVFEIVSRVAPGTAKR